jgi:hypothetical protein
MACLPLADSEALAFAALCRLSSVLSFSEALRLRGSEALFLPLHFPVYNPPVYIQKYISTFPMCPAMQRREGFCAIRNSILFLNLIANG